MKFSFQDGRYTALDFPLRHGFTGVGCTIPKESEQSEKDSFCRTLEIADITFVKQIHSASFVDLEGITVETKADAIVSRYDPENPTDKAIAVFTADCIPLLLVTDSYVAAVHAGWRGLADGIIQKTVEHILSKSKGQEFTALIGPCAGPDRYEVGEEVIAALGEGVRYKDSSSPGKYILDLAGTASSVLEVYKPDEIGVCPVCTISDERFHSYRREGPVSGRNVSYIVC